MSGVIAIVVISCVIGMIWAVFNYLMIKKVPIGGGTTGDYQQVDDSGVTETEARVINEIGAKIADGAKEFLRQEYLVCIIFVFVMFFIIYGAVEKFHTAYTAFAFVIGAVTSMICGAIGMMIATYTNYRVTYHAKKGLAEAFRTAYRGGCVMGFALVSIALMSKFGVTQCCWFSSSSSSPSCPRVTTPPVTTDGTRSYSSPSLGTALEDPQWLFLAELEEEFTPRLPMWELILLGKSRRTFQRIVLGTLPQLLTTLEITLETSQVWEPICSDPSLNPPALPSLSLPTPSSPPMEPARLMGSCIFRT